MSWSLNSAHSRFLTSRCTFSQLRVRSRSWARKLLSVVVLVVVTALLFYCFKIPYKSFSGPMAKHTLEERPAGPSEDLSERYRPADDAQLPRASSPFLDKVASCDSLDCLREAHMLPRGAAKFNHPHFLIIGFQKVRDRLGNPRLTADEAHPDHCPPRASLRSSNGSSPVPYGLNSDRRQRPRVCTATWHVITRRLPPASRSPSSSSTAAVPRYRRGAHGTQRSSTFTPRYDHGYIWIGTVRRGVSRVAP